MSEGGYLAPTSQGLEAEGVPISALDLVLYEMNTYSSAAALSL